MITYAKIVLDLLHSMLLSLIHRVTVT